jgi:hypothetical protein
MFTCTLIRSAILDSSCLLGFLGAFQQEKRGLVPRVLLHIQQRPPRG